MRDAVIAETKSRMEEKEIEEKKAASVLASAFFCTAADPARLSPPSHIHYIRGASAARLTLARETVILRRQPQPLSLSLSGPRDKTELSRLLPRKASRLYIYTFCPLSPASRASPNNFEACRRRHEFLTSRPRHAGPPRPKGCIHGVVCLYAQLPKGRGRRVFRDFSPYAITVNDFLAVARERERENESRAIYELRESSRKWKLFQP